ncbi:peptidylprolyl isomerase [Limibacter armeniacum]|uniref:peptidylprolyl isomerase n=1 Tax=Limibacter armeniacum TaxID=466084 RepID=UPI002FE69028
MQKFLTSPLLHFFLLGAVIFVIYHFTNSKPEVDTILIDNSDIQQMVSKWEVKWNRKPNTEELSNLIDDAINQEVLYREALKMKLEHNDEVIKRRLAQKMQFITSDLAKIKAPLEKDLQQFFEKNKEKYSTKTSYSLYQITFNYSKGNNAKLNAKELLIKNEKATIEEMKGKGDVSVIPFYLEKMDIDQLRNKVSLQFAQSINDLETGKWEGPISSGFGEHLVYITAKEAPQIPKLNTIKNQITRDWYYEQEQNIYASILEELKKKYKIKIDIESSSSEIDILKLQQEN